jgi:hypothetical protein
VLSAAAIAQTPSSLATPPKLGQITIDEYKELIWQPEDNYIKSPGHVRIVMQDADTGELTTLIADDAEGSPTGDIIVKGNLRLIRGEGTLTGRALTYRAATRTGVVLNAQAQLANALVTGEKIELMPNQDVKAFRASFTTCIERIPHYHVTARELTLNTKRQVRAKQITFWLGRTRVISLPSYKKDFSKSVENPIPLPGYSKENFLQFHFRDDILAEPKTSFNYDVQLSLRRTPSGSLVYESDLGHPSDDQSPPRTRRFAATEPLRTALETSPALLRGSIPEAEEKRTSLYAMLTSNNFVYNRQRTDLRVSRLPEVGISARNIFNRKPPNPEGGPISVFGTGFFTPANWLLNAEAGFGYFQERGDNLRANDSRLGLRADAASPSSRITGPLYVRYGATAWQNFYGNGNSYTLLAPEAELTYLLRPNTLIGAGYRYQHDFGRTPFVFDRRDVRHEMRLRYGFLGARWAYDMELKYDMERLRAYDSIFAIRKRLDCMEFGVAYRTRSQSFNLLLNLIPVKTKPTGVKAAPAGQR